jgi:spore maturation protein CgeB
MVILAGGFYLGEYSTGMSQMLHDGVHCSWYRDLDDCIDRAGEFLSGDKERQAIRARGEEFVRANHTYDQRAPFILEDRAWVNPL